MDVVEQGKEGYDGYRELVVNGKALAVPEGSVAMVRAIPPKQRKKIIRDNRVLLKDVFPLLANPARSFRGPLAGVRGGFLRKLHLPVMLPVGDGLPEYSDELASLMVVIYDGWWSGVILCSEVTGAPVRLSSYVRGPNGDITGIADRTDVRGRCLVLDAVKLLRREGFLVVA